MNSDNPMPEDRRARPRVAVQLILSIEQDSSWKLIESSRNLSMGGMAISSDVAFSEGEEIRLRFQFGEDVSSREFVVGATVTRCLPQSEGYDVGLKFLPLESDTSIFLYRLIQYHQD